MHRIGKKLHSARGASILIALGFFLVCAFVGAVVLGSATTNAQKAEGRQTREQTYDSVGSAARLVQTVMDGMEFTGREYRTIHECNSDAYRDILVDHDAHADTASADSEDSTNISCPDEVVSDLVKQMAFRVFRSKTDYVSPIPNAGGTAAFSITAEGMDQVDVTMEMSGEDYQVTFTFVSHASPQLYRMTLTCPAGTPDIGETQEPDSCTHRVKNADGSITERQFSLTQDTRVTTVHWTRGTIAKG